MMPGMANVRQKLRSQNEMVRARYRDELTQATQLSIPFH
jgi:hypothetical protein